jgi:catecholate siderophore receptor
MKNAKTRLPASFRTVSLTPPPSMVKTSLALGISTAMMMPLTSLAAEPGKESATTLKAVKVQDKVIDPNPNAEPGVPYKARTSADQRHTRPLAETPQTIQVLTSEAIKDSGSSDLREIVDAQPGITLGTGENGNAFGDRYIIRGQEARSDVFVDGLRDPGMTIREIFAVEQLEISKGPNSSFAGRGTVGGAINAVTKQATTDLTFNKLSAGLGSDNHQRYTLDTNLPVNDQITVRANLLWVKEDVPDRDPADRDRKGIALSGLWRPIDKLDVSLDYYGFRGHDNPDVGTYVNRLAGGISSGNIGDARDDMPVYVQDSDFLQSEVDTYTARVSHEFSDTLGIANLTRYGTTDNSYVNVGAGPNFTGVNNPGGVYATATMDNGHSAWQEVEYFANQTNLYITQELAGMKHEFIAGVEYTNHQLTRGNFSLNIPAGAAGGRNCITGTGTTLNAFCITDANGNPVSNVHNLQVRDITKNNWSFDWSVQTVSTYFMDTVDLTDDWTLFAGLRYDKYELSATSVNAATRAVTFDVDDDDNLVTGHIGVTYKINPEGMVYLSAATAQDINGGESDATGSGYGGLVVLNGEPAAEPETSESFELGTKWNLFDERLLLTAAVFQNTKSDVMEGLNGADYSTTGTYNTGENRVSGVEIGATGEITDNLTVQAGFTLMNSEVLESHYPAYEGAALANFAEKSGHVQIKYDITEALAVGAIARYESQRFVGQPDTAAVNATTGDKNWSVPSYTVFDAFVSYDVTRDLDVRLNINNLTDEDYYLAGYRSGNFVYIGDARQYVVTATYNF